MDVNAIAHRPAALPLSQATKGLEKASQKSDGKGLERAQEEASEQRALPEGVGAFVNVEA